MNNYPFTTLLARSKASLSYQARNKSLGLCVKCREVLDGESKVFCTKHKLYNRAKSIERRLGK